MNLIKNHEILDLDSLSCKILLYFLTSNEELISLNTLESILGIHRDTLTRKLNNLVDRNWVLKIKEGRCVSFKLNCKISDIKKESEKEDISFGARDFINLFCKKYLEKYNTAYTVNYAKDLKLVKSKLINIYTKEELEYILEQTFKDYDRKYANAKYQRPTVGAITTFLPNLILKGKPSEKTSEKTSGEEEKKEDFEKYYSQTF